MSTILSDIVESSPDAKALKDSMTARWLVVMAVGWTAQNIVAWLHLDQSLTATVATGLLGLISFVGALIGIMRRSGIRVPGWLVAFIDAVQNEERKP